MLLALCPTAALALPTSPSKPVVPATPSEWKRVLAQGTPAVLPATDEEWKRVLEPLQFAVLREEATEPTWSSELNEIKDEGGVFLCAGCATPLFTSAGKFESGSGWPSFWAPVNAESIATRTDFKALVPRTEILCGTCNGHLGHSFSDGPPPTGQRYCMNGAALTYESGTDRADAAVRTFELRREAFQPPLTKSVVEAGLSSLLCVGLLYSFYVNLQADLGQPWAIVALRSSDTWLFGAVNAVFGRPPGGPLTLVLAALNAGTVSQKLPLIRAGLERRKAPAGGGPGDED